MGLDSHREKADGILDPLAKSMSGTNPDLLTILSLLFAIAAGFFFFLGSILGLFLAFLMVFSNSLLDALDGKVARLTGKASKRGDYLDHLVDRYSDMAMLAGIALGPWCRDWIGVLAIVGVFMTSYTGTQAQAMGLGRNYGGILGRADRQVMLMLFPLIQILMSLYVGGELVMPGVVFRFTLMEFMMLWFAFAGNVTAIQRARKAWAELSLGDKT